MQIPHIVESVEQEEDSLGMAIFWVSAQVIEEEQTDLNLMLSFELSGPKIPNNAYVMAYASFLDPDNEDMYETVACVAEYD